VGIPARRTVPARGSLAALWVLVLTLPLVASVEMLQADATPVDAIWQQPVVTVDDATLEQITREQWRPPFRVALAERGQADITVEVARLDDAAGGEATRTVDGDRITSCRITLRPGADLGPVLAHELGHCFGLHHDNEHPGSLMYWIQGGASGAPAVTERDRAALVALYTGTG